MKITILIIASILFTNCGDMFNDCGDSCSGLKELKSIDTLSILSSQDTIKMFLTQNTIYRKRLINVSTIPAPELNDTSILIFYLTKNDREEEDKESANFEWNNDTLNIWFETHWRDATIQDTISPYGEILKKKSCECVPPTIDLDSVIIYGNKTYFIKQDTSDLRE